MENTTTNSYAQITGTNATTLTMSSREIAELTGKLHKHILRDIEKMIQDIDEPKFGLVDFEAKYQDGKGEWRKEYLLPKDLTVTLVTGYRADLRYKVVKKLEQLEGQQVPFDYSNPAVVLGVISRLQEQVQGRQVPLKKLDSQDISTRKDWKHTHRVRQAKLALVSAVNRLDNLGIDVAAIAMPDVLAFSRKINSIGVAK